MTPTVITRTLPAHTSGLGLQLDVVFRYSPLDPFAVHFQTRGGQHYVIDRDVLANGIAGADGLGDIHVQEHTDPDWIAVHVKILNWHPVLLFRRKDLVDFLVATWSQVPMGSEADRYSDAWFTAELKRLHKEVAG